MPKNRKDLFAELHAISHETALLKSVENLLEWDQETHMPSDAISLRAAQLEALSGLIHKRKTSSKFSKALSKLINIETGQIIDKTRSEAELSALREWRRDYLKLVKLPPAFVKIFSKTTATASHVWMKARKDNAFSQFAPYLEKIVSLCRKKADLLGFAEHPYDALLDLYEPGMKTSSLTPLFAKLKLSLTSLLKAIQVHPQPNTDFIHGHFSSAKQLEFGHILLQAMGFENSFSKLDLSTHPFCQGLHPNDTRMTTRIHPDSLMSNIYTIIHEGGHGLYNRGLLEKYYGSPLCESVSLGIDESQSRFWETLIGRSHPFWRHFFPKLQEFFPEKLKNISLDNFYRAINVVKPSLIRVEADEVTYSLHVILRFEIEKALIEGSLKIREIPEAWNAKMREYLGLSPDSDSVGCLQDIHWSMGGIGYFPTYSLGNLYACQFFEVFEKNYPDWQTRVSQGDLRFIREWLKENIHQYGRQYTPSELVQRITHKPLSEEAFVNHLKKKYQALYHLGN